MIVSPTAIDESSLCILLTYSMPFANSLEIIQSPKLNTIYCIGMGVFALILHTLITTGSCFGKKHNVSSSWIIQMIYSMF